MFYNSRKYLFKRNPFSTLLVNFKKVGFNKWRFTGLAKWINRPKNLTLACCAVFANFSITCPSYIM